MLSLAIAGGALACYRLCGDYAPGAPGSMVLLAAGLPLLFGIAVAPARRAAIVRVLAIAAVLPVVDLVGRAVEVRVHALPLVNHALSWLAGLVGMPASVAGGLLNVRAHEGLIAFAASFDKLALRPVASVVIACLLATRSWSRTGVLALAAAMLAVLRYGVLLLWFADRDGALVPKDGWALGVFTSDLTVLPLLLAVALLGREDRQAGAGLAARARAGAGRRHSARLRHAVRAIGRGEARARVDRRSPEQLLGTDRAAARHRVLR
ncbi:MAG: hypothetical protein U1E76_03650 [Planctomycetota bacterium]